MNNIYINNKNDLDLFIANIINHNNGTIESFTPSQMMDREFVANNRGLITDAMIFQLLKKKFREYVVNNLPNYFKSIGKKNKYDEELYDFNEKDVPNDMRENLQSARDYLNNVCIGYLDEKLANPKSKIALNHLNGNPKHKTLSDIFAASENWHLELAKMAEKKKNAADMLEKSKQGVDEVIKYPDGAIAYELKTEDALKFEGDNMGHCVGGYYERVKKGEIRIFSIRDELGAPHVTFEVNGAGEIIQCKGRANKAPIPKYVPYIQHFVNETEFRPAADLQNMGLVRGLDDKFYNLYRLPDGFECDVLSLSGLDYSKIKLPKNLRANNLNFNGTSNISGEFDFSRSQEVALGDCDLSNVKITGLPKSKLYLAGAKNISGEFDFSGLDEVNLGGCNLSNVKITGLPKKELDLAYAKNLSGELDLSICHEVDLNACDLTNVKITGVPKSKLDLTYVTNIQGELDLSACEVVYLRACDLSNLKITGIPKKELDLSNVTNISGEFDFSETKMVYLRDCDLSNIKIIGFPKKYLNLTNATNVSGEFDCSTLVFASFKDCDLSNVKITGIPSEKFNLSGAKNVSGELDLSVCENVYLDNSDLSKVTKITIRKNQKSIIPKDFPKDRLVIKKDNLQKNRFQAGIDKLKKGLKELDANPLIKSQSIGLDK